MSDLFQNIGMGLSNQLPAAGPNAAMGGAAGAGMSAGTDMMSPYLAGAAPSITGPTGFGQNFGELLRGYGGGLVGQPNNGMGGANLIGSILGQLSQSQNPQMGALAQLFPLMQGRGGIQQARPLPQLPGQQGSGGGADALGSIISIIAALV